MAPQPDAVGPDRRQQCITPEGQAERCRVLLRFRPPPAMDLGKGVDAPGTPFEVQGETVTVRPRDAGGVEDVSFTFDKVFPDSATQDDVFQSVMHDSVTSVLTGCNATVLAYGQSGAGKTYTMFGDNGNRGIIPRALDEIFSRITADDGGGVFVVKASMLEIYREELKDLLRPSTHKLRLRESAFDGIWVEGLHHIYVPTAAVAVQLLQEGIASRVVGSTGMNSQSSRSHCIFSLRVEQQHPDGFVQRGELHFADLAGLERVDRTGAHGQSLEEAKRINLSLSALGNCISALAQPGRAHIPFRDAKLTFLLKNSLGGNARTTLLINASSRWKDFEETMTAFKFGARARAIKNVVKVNRKLSAEELERLLSKLKGEHDALRAHCASLEQQMASLVESQDTIGEKASVLTPMTDKTNLQTPSQLRRRKSEGTPVDTASLSAVCNRWRRSVANDEWEVPSPIRNLDPMKLLHRISELESANVDMQIEIESLVMQQQTLSPNAVVGTSLARHTSRGLASPPLLSDNTKLEVPSSICHNVGARSELDSSCASIKMKTPKATGGGLDMSLQTSFNLGALQEWATSLPRIETSMQTSPFVTGLAKVSTCDSTPEKEAEGSHVDHLHVAKIDVACQSCSGELLNSQDEGSMCAEDKLKLKAAMSKKRSNSFFGSFHPVTCWLEKRASLPASSSLFYASGEESADGVVRKEVPLGHVSAVESVDSGKGRYGIRLHHRSREYEFVMGDASVRDEWHDAIKAVLDA